MANDDSSDQIGNSVLGTKEYWENAYETDLENYEITDDSGEIWFGRSCQCRIVKWLSTCTEINRETCRILDLGCGNGALSLALRELGYKKVTGVDYAPTAIKLARSVAERKGFPDISFEILDILDTDCDVVKRFQGGFDLLLDKGTFDAIGLMRNAAESRQAYKTNALSFYDHQSSVRLLIIASCNSTKIELLDFFSPEFVYVDEIVAATNYTFGGKAGSTVTTVVLRLSDQR